MPFNFQDTYVNPNVQIKGEEIPLEQLEKTSNIIQGRYDTSMDNETKIGAITKKLLASSNPIDHETAKQIMENSKNRLAERAKAGNYQDMVWQTQQDAMDAASMFEGLSNRNKEISEYEKSIDLNAANSPEIKNYQKQKFKNSLLKSKFNPENMTLEGLNVSAPSIVNAVDYEKHFMDIAGQWKPDVIGGKNVKTINTNKGDVLPDGTVSEGGMYKVIGNHVKERVSEKDLRNHLEKSALSNDLLQAALKQDREVYGDDIAFQRYHNAINAAIDAHSYTRQLANEDSYIFNPASTNAYNDINNNKSFLDQLFLSPKLDKIQGEVNLDKVKETNAKIDILKKLNFNPDGSLKKSLINSEVYSKDQPFMFGQKEKIDLNKIENIIPPALYKTMKEKGHSDKDMVLAYHNNLDRYKKTINTEYNFLDPKTQNSFTEQIKNGAKGNLFIDSDNDEVTLDDKDLKDATVKMIPGEGKYVVIADGKKYIPKAIDPSIQNYLNSASELLYEFNDLSNTVNMVDIPLYYKGVKRTAKAVIRKTDIRPDGSYTGTIALRAKNPNGKYVDISKPIEYDTQNNDSPEIINQLINNYLGAATATQGLYE